MRAFAFLLMILAFQTSYAAYVTADLVTAGENPAIGTHLVISGNGMEEGRAWLEMAHAQALVFADKRQHGSVHVISGIMQDSDVDQMREWGYANIEIHKQSYNATALLSEIKKVPVIASMDLIGHDGAILGFALQDYNHRFFLDAIQALASYRTHFTADSYIRLQGCNTGWRLAPAIAQTLQVPTAGSLTAEDIQFLHNNHNWYFDIPGHYPDGGVSATNDISFGKPEVCNHSGCQRLKTSDQHYDGKHGNYTGTVPFLKFFCGSVAQNDCFRRMALSTSTLFGVTDVEGKPSLDDYARVVADQFCNDSANPAPYADCTAKVTAQLTTKGPVLPATYSPVGDPMLTCSFTKCNFTMRCGKDCDMVGDLSHPSTVFVDELNAYRIGYGLWN